MRKYLLPAVVCAAIGALVLVFFLRGEKLPRRLDPPPKTVSATRPQPESPLGRPAETLTPLDEHKWLRELQRSLAGNLAHAMDYRQKVCEDMDAIRASESLSKDLLETIRQYGTECDDPARRDVVLPILRVFEHPEATRMIAEEYYETKDEAEQMTLLEAMSKPFHDPRQATVWGVEKALTSPSPEHRERAFDILKTYVIDNELLVETSKQVYSGSLDERQRQVALRTIVDRGDVSDLAREFARRILRNPSGIEDVYTVMGSLVTWGDEDDAAQLDRLAEEFPAAGEALRQHARIVRRRIFEKEHPTTPYQDEHERKEQEEVDRKEREAEGAGGQEPAGD